MEFVQSNSIFFVHGSKEYSKNRRERDSNPRYERRSYNGLAISRFRPLSHLSRRQKVHKIVNAEGRNIKKVEFFLQTQNTCAPFAPFGQFVVLCFSICLKLFPLFWLCSKKKKNERIFPFSMLDWICKGEKGRKKDHPGTKLLFPARLPTSWSTSSAFHSQVRDGLAWFHRSIEHQSLSGAKLRRFVFLFLFFEEKNRSKSMSL